MIETLQPKIIFASQQEQRETGITPHYEVAVIGTGPQGLSIANELLKRNINFALIGKPKKTGQTKPDLGGALATYNIPANSKGNELLLDIQEHTPLQEVNRKWSTRRLARQKNTAPNLKKKIGPYLRGVGREITRLKRTHIYAREVAHTVWDGKKHILFDKNGKAFLTSDFVSFNIGAHEKSLVKTDRRFAPYTQRIQSSIDVIQGKSLKELKHELSQTPEKDRYIIIVGASHTAFTDAALLTKRRIKIGNFDRKNSQVIRFLELLLPKTIGDYIPPGRLLIAYRGKGDIKVFADHAKAAVLEGLEEGPPECVDPNKVCPVTKRYRRFIGFREWAKDVYLNWKNGLEPRIELVNIEDIPHEVLKKAIIIQAIGLEGNEFTIFDIQGKKYSLPKQHGNITGTTNGQLPGVPHTYGGGIGVDVLLPDDLGGEPEFSYEDNSPRHLHFVAGYNEVAKRIASDIEQRLRKTTSGIERR